MILPRAHSGLLLLAALSSLPLAAAWAADPVPEPAAIARSLARLAIEDQGYRAAIEVAAAKEQAIPALIRNLDSPDPTVRKWSARAVTDMVGGYRDYRGRPTAAPAGPALLRALRQEQDVQVALFLIQAIGCVQPPADQALPLLIGLLADPNVELRRVAVDSLGEYGKDAQPAVDALISSLAGEKDAWTANWILEALFKIAPGEALADRLAVTPIVAGADVRGTLFSCLLPYPAAAGRLLDDHPDALAGFNELSVTMFIPLLNAGDAASQAFRDKLARRSDLPSSLIAVLGDGRHMAVLKQRFKEADPHERLFLSACMRALGAPPGERIVSISATDPGDFKPRSAWPGSDDSRWDSGSGHGDGIQLVLITGAVRCSDGAIPRSVAFRDANGGRQFGSGIQQAAKVVYYPSNGRFAYLTCVGAAFAMSRAKRDRGPYQTVADKVTIEADHAQPLTVSFYDEMPDVLITLTTSPAK